MARIKVGVLRSNELGSSGSGAAIGAGASIVGAKAIGKALSSKHKSQEELVKSAKDKISKMTQEEIARTKEQIEKRKSDRKTEKVNNDIDKAIAKKSKAGSSMSKRKIKVKAKKKTKKNKITYKPQKSKRKQKKADKKFDKDIGKEFKEVREAFKNHYKKLEKDYVPNPKTEKKIMDYVRNNPTKSRPKTDSEKFYPKKKK